MIDFGKTFCDLHPNELISNFCCKEECKVGLCATCICSHTDMHMHRKTAPDYQNIRVTYTKIQDHLRNRIMALDQQKTRISYVLAAIQDKHQQIIDCVAQARHETLQFVNGYFDEREKELMRQAQADEKKTSLHSENRMQSLMNKILREIKTLYNSANELNSQNFLQSFQRISNQVLINSLQTEKQIVEELDNNQNYETAVTISPNFTNGVRLWLQKSITITFGLKNQQQKYSDGKETNKNSRLILEQGNNSSSTTKRYADSSSKSSLVAPAMYSPQIIDSFASYFPKSTQYQPFPRRTTTETIYINNSMPMAQIMNSSICNSSRAEQKDKGTEKNIKQNTSLLLKRSGMNQSQMENKYFSQDPQFDHKKMRKSGLTIFKPIDNQSKHKN